MAFTIKQNPVYFSGPKMERVKMTALDGQTWQPGQFVKFTDSGVVKCATGAIAIHGMTCSSQPVATSSSKVWVDKITSDQTKFIVGVSSANSDAKALESYIGNNMGLCVNTSVCAMAVGNDSGAVLKYVGRYVDYETSGRNSTDTNDEPGYCIASVLNTAIAAEIVGVA